MYWAATGLMVFFLLLMYYSISQQTLELKKEENTRMKSFTQGGAIIAEWEMLTWLLQVQKYVTGHILSVLRMEQKKNEIY